MHANCCSCWSLLEAILKSKTEHIMENHHCCESAINETFIKRYSHTFFFWQGGGTVPDVETNNLSSNFSLRGTMSTGMTVSDKAVVFWKISEIHLEESKLTPRPTMHGGRRSSWRRRFYFLWRFVMGEKVNQDSSAGQCDVPQTNRTTNFSLPGLTLWEKLCQAAVLGINSVCLLCSAS